uniref:Ras guanyl-releasing protein 3 n=1 Tax=Parascaris univalens TaxID=6257 RepID=A0A915C0U2_PARUN
MMPFFLEVYSLSAIEISGIVGMRSKTRLRTVSAVSESGSPEGVAGCSSSNTCRSSVLMPWFDSNKNRAGSETTDCYR